VRRNLRIIFGAVQDKWQWRRWNFDQINYMTRQIWLNKLKLADLSVRAMSYKYSYIIIGQLREDSTPTQKEKDDLEDLKLDGGIVWARISDSYERGTGRAWL
jgi:hypothetical protein